MKMNSELTTSTPVVVELFKTTQAPVYIVEYLKVNFSAEIDARQIQINSHSSSPNATAVVFDINYGKDIHALMYFFFQSYLSDKSIYELLFYKGQDLDLNIENILSDYGDLKNASKRAQELYEEFKRSDYEPHHLNPTIPPLDGIEFSSTDSDKNTVEFMRSSWHLGSMIRAFEPICDSITWPLPSWLQRSIYSNTSNKHNGFEWLYGIYRVFCELKLILLFPTTSPPWSDSELLNRLRVVATTALNSKSITNYST